MEQKSPLPSIPEPSEIPVSPPVNSSSLKKPILIVLSVILLLILTSLCTYFFVKSQTVSPTPVISPTPTLSTSLIPSTSDQTTKWKTYINDTFGVSFNYPSNWIYGEYDNGHNRNGLNIYLRPKELKVADPTYGEINIWVFNTTKTPNEFADSELCSEPGRCNLSKNAESIKLGERDAIIVKDKGGPLPSDTILVKNDNSIIEIDFSYQGESRKNYSNTESKKIFDQILSTFKFANNNQISPTQNGKTYTNVKIGYSFKYPTTWVICPDDPAGEIKDTGVDICSVSEPHDLIMTAFVDNPQNLDFQQLVTKDLSTDIKNNFKYTKELINQKPAYITRSFPGASEYESVFFKLQNIGYIQISYQPYNSESGFSENYTSYKIFHQILSTFKFN